MHIYDIWMEVKDSFPHLKLEINQVYLFWDQKLHTSEYKSCITLQKIEIRKNDLCPLLVYEINTRQIEKSTS